MDQNVQIIWTMLEFDLYGITWYSAWAGGTQYCEIWISSFIVFTPLWFVLNINRETFHIRMPSSSMVTVLMILRSDSIARCLLYCALQQIYRLLCILHYLKDNNTLYHLWHPFLDRVIFDLSPIVTAKTHSNIYFPNQESLLIWCSLVDLYWIICNP